MFTFGIKVPVTGVSLGTPTLAGGLTTLFSFLQGSISYNYACYFITMWERGIYINNVTLCAYQGYALLPPVWQYIDGDYMGS